MSWHDFAQISLTYSIIIHKHSISSWFKAPSLHVPMYHWNEAADELQNLPSCDGGTHRLFCVPKGIFRVLQSCTGKMLTYEHGCSAWRRYSQGSVYSHNLVGTHVIFLLWYAPPAAFSNFKTANTLSRLHGLHITRVALKTLQNTLS